MKQLPENQCRRCGHVHDDLFQMVDPQCHWAVVSASCHCGHRWVTIHTAPVNLRALRLWVSMGCPSDALKPTVPGGAWQVYRMEGVGPVALPSAS